MAELELERGDDACHVGVATALAVAVDAGLHLLHSLFARRKAVGDRHVRVIVTVDSQRNVWMRLLHHLDALQERGWERAAVGVAQDQRIDTVVYGGSQAGQRIVLIGIEAIKEVLCIEEYAL